MKYFVIFNPVSGRGRGAKLTPLIERTLRELGQDFHLTQTERPWHAAELAEQASQDGYDAVVTASGDGTANEALNGLTKARQAGFKQTALGILSIGTGNDLAASLGIPTGLREAVQALKSGARRVIDIGVTA
jgi:diacylglycerol kinase (ATP)